MKMYKSKLQELCHQYSWNLPEYTAVKDGPDHNPRFRATVTVNGVQFHTPTLDQFRSSKDAQNQAAKIAFDHFTAPKSILQHHSSSSPPSSSSSSPRPSSSSSSSSNSSPPIPPPSSGFCLQPSVQTLYNNAAPVDCEEISHLYKNRLQIYAQKKNLALPTYSCETDGPPHVRRFKSMVTIDDKTYGSADFYSTLKEAEHAAAKVAFESLSSVETHEEDETLYKSLLQELTHKEGFVAPTYETVKSGPPHTPTFLSNVVIKGETHQGKEAKTKKQAEMNAAKAAYKVLIERCARRKQTAKSPVSYESQPNVMNELHGKFEAKTRIIPIQEGKAEEDKGHSRRSPGGHFKGPREVSLYKVKSTGNDEVQPNARGKTNNLIHEKQVKEGKDTNINATGSKAMEYYTNSETEATAHSKVLVCPSDLNLAYPRGSTILPFSDDKWVAMKVEN